MPGHQTSTPTHAFEAVRQATVDAIREAVLEASRTVPGDALAGFGLCTDDAVDSVFHAYATRAWVAERQEDYPEIGLISVEWEQTSDDTGFLAVSDRLRRWHRAQDDVAQADYDRDRTLRFRALVEALEICRGAGLFDAGTLLSVSSVDPDEVMVRLACHAARRLNSEEVALGYCQMMGC